MDELDFLKEILEKIKQAESKLKLLTVAMNELHEKAGKLQEAIEDPSLTPEERRKLEEELIKINFTLQKLSDELRATQRELEDMLEIINQLLNKTADIINSIAKNTN